MTRCSKSQAPQVPLSSSIPRSRHLLSSAIYALLCLFISAILATALAVEQASNDPCPEAMTQAAMQACFNMRYQQVDATLNQVYKQLMAQLSPTQRTQFKQAQRAWIAFRDASAAFAASTAEGGSMAPLLSLTELVSMTETRIVTMQEILRELQAR